MRPQASCLSQAHCLMPCREKSLSSCSSQVGTTVALAMHFQKYTDLRGGVSFHNRVVGKKDGGGSKPRRRLWI